ncbi:hypothetical protein H310_03385 [Aphanomyces invadans]|uniref:Myb-like domain-containing protein n=1 Tax=Aphanomyces invadans TaxID=157072 RepID=A0A024UJ60_9STRA|nr:hypothetical protein H310_03385 [Aphanomyces invadans]ETW05663.1 hypothetical protein H310_03385 [Aphanomyces invadans]|eukprot:XP_008865440.1 hypothetical protein H310_03385 [Aphanomyces invadans]
MPPKSKRRNFSKEEDVLLLRQVASEMPFLARHGLIMDKWTAVAHALASSDEFGRPDFDGKKASNRFSALIEAHKKKKNEFARASGVAEDMTEKDALMDDLIAAYDDAKEEARRAIESKQALEQNESMGAFVREEAMTSLGKRKKGDDDSGGTAGGGKMMKAMIMLHEQSNAELDFLREMFHREMEEREKDRMILAEQIRQQHESTLKQQESMLNLMNSLINKL